MRKVGCNPKHWKVESNLPNCSKIEQYKDLNKNLYKKNVFMPPCRSIEGLSTQKQETDLGFRCLQNSYLDLFFYLDEEKMYKEIILVPAYSFQSLIGNAGKNSTNCFENCNAIHLITKYFN